MRNRNRTNPIPNGSEPGAVEIPLFDHSTHRPMRKKQFVYLAAPIPLYNTARYDDAVAQIRARHPNADILLPFGMFASAAVWARTYRTVLNEVTHVYTLAHANGTIGSGAYAELVHIVTRVKSPARYHAAFMPDATNPGKNQITTIGAFAPLATGWDWKHAAGLVTAEAVHANAVARERHERTALTAKRAAGRAEGARRRAALATGPGRGPAEAAHAKLRKAYEDARAVNTVARTAHDAARKAVPGAATPLFGHGFSVSERNRRHQTVR